MAMWGKSIPGGRNSKFKDGNKPGTFTGSEASGAVAERVRGREITEPVWVFENH